MMGSDVQEIYDSLDSIFEFVLQFHRYKVIEKWKPTSLASQGKKG